MFLGSSCSFLSDFLRNFNFFCILVYFLFQAFCVDFGRMDFKILILVLALGVICGCKCSASVETTNDYPNESGIDSVGLQKINLQQQPQSEVDVVVALRKKDKICKLCRKIAKPVLKFLSNSTNQNKIKSVLDKICSALPGSFKDKCNDKVGFYFPLFVTQMKVWTPRTFCVGLNLCDLIPILSSDLSEDICDSCNDLVKELSLRLKDPSAQLKTIEVLMKGCDALEDFEGLPEKCKTLVSSFAPLILDNAEQLFAPNAAEKVDYAI